MYASLIAGIYGSAEVPSSAQELIPAQFYMTIGIKSESSGCARGIKDGQTSMYMYIYVICIIIYRRCFFLFSTWKLLLAFNA